MIRSDMLMAKMEKNQLVNESDLIVAGTVLSQEVAKDFTRFPVTDTRIRVEHVYKGKAASTVEVRVAGREKEDMIYEVGEDAGPTFKIGEQDLRVKERFEEMTISVQGGRHFFWEFVFPINR